MKSKDIDTVTDEDIAYWKSMDFSNAKRANEIPIIKALQSNPKARTMYVPRKKPLLCGLMKIFLPYSNRADAVIRHALTECCENGLKTVWLINKNNKNLLKINRFFYFQAACLNALKILLLIYYILHYNFAP